MPFEHILLKNKTNAHIQRAIKYSSSPYSACNDRKAFFHDNQAMMLSRLLITGTSMTR